MQKDIFIEIGNSHKVCEDSIITGDKPFPYIILSDGCSTSNNTDIGSRILCHLAKQYLKFNKDYEYNVMGSWIIHNAEVVVRQLGLPISCLDATLIIACEMDNHINIKIYGDGCIITKNNDDCIIYTTIEFHQNAPYYLSYELDIDNKNKYNSLVQYKKIKDYEIRKNYDLPFEKTSLSNTPVEYSFKSELYQMVMISSDGLESFVKKLAISEAVDVPTFISKFLDFKMTQGVFLQRRLNKQMKDFQKENIGHYDDLSVGCFLRE